jgi:hypothetical protein
VLNYLDQAGGIDVAAGSFRDVRVLRDRRPIAEIDLYPFLLDGLLPQPQFEDGDTIVVGRQGPMVTATGDVAQPYRYELSARTQSVGELLHWVQLRPGVSHVLLTGVRDVGPFSSYVPLDDLDAHWLQAGDELLFSVDQRHETIVVQVEGSFSGPSRFTVPRDARLMELLDSIPVDPRLADVDSVSIRRKSVAQRQRESLDESLKRLETAYLGASSSTVDESKIRIEEAKLIQDFVNRARQLDPSGRLVVAEGGSVRDTILQDGDVVTIPNRSDSIFVSGEVLVPQAMVYQDRQASTIISSAPVASRIAPTKRRPAGAPEWRGRGRRKGASQTRRRDPGPARDSDQKPGAGQDPDADPLSARRGHQGGAGSLIMAQSRYMGRR